MAYFLSIAIATTIIVAMNNRQRTVLIDILKGLGLFAMILICLCITLYCIYNALTTPIVIPVRLVQ